MIYLCQMKRSQDTNKLHLIGVMIVQFKTVFVQYVGVLMDVSMLFIYWIYFMLGLAGVSIISAIIEMFMSK
jgi:hypothetical protein